jgi:ribonuclease HI
MKYFKLDETTPIVADGIVLYCDGSARPNPGFIGAGIHGYAFNEAEPKKGTGLATHTMTKTGYVDNKEDAQAPRMGQMHEITDGSGKPSPTKNGKPVKITPVMYYNTAASFDFQTTNNVAELMAVHIGIRMALATKTKSLLIKTDSEYVNKVLTKFAALWVRSNWLKRDGTPVSNQDFIKDLLVSVAELQTRGIKFEIQWVKGHSTYIGNIAADRLANIGSAMSKAKEIRVNVQEHQPEGYWKQDNTRHPMLSHRRLYFGTTMKDLATGTYYLGDHGKEDDFVGRAEVDGALAVVVLKKPDAVIDAVMKRCYELAGTSLRFFFGRLDAIFSKNRNKDIELYKDAALICQEGERRLNVESGDEAELVRDLQPIRLSERTFDCLGEMRARMEAHFSGHDQPRTVVNDITHLFYDVSRKIVKNVDTETYELHKKYIVGYRCERVKVKHERGESELILTFGIDVPDRNAWKRMEAMRPKVKLLTWMESDQCVRYATIIETADGDRSIWCGYYSNQLYLGK